MILWHYTSVSVLASIFSKSPPTLRASNILHLNDSAELEHGLNGLMYLIESESPVGRLAALREPLNSLLNSMNGGYDPNIYSFSLSEYADSLYQWIAYCPPHSGIALGFELPEPAAKRISEQQLFYLPIPTEPDKCQIPQYRKCHYFRQNIELNELSRDWIEVVDGKHLNATLLTNAMFLKHSAFHFEREHRLFFHPMPDNPWKIPIEFNANKPFVNFHFRPEILRQICVSPRGDKKLTRRTVGKILAVNNLGNVEVLVSDIPFRE